MNLPKIHRDLDPYVSKRLHAMEMIVERTNMAGPILVFPFVLLPLFMFARITVFEGWVWTWTMIAFLVGLTIYMLVQVLEFQSEAAVARGEVIRDIEDHRHSLVGDKPQRKRVKGVINDIRNIRRGAFVPWLRRPIVQSAMLPLLGLVVVLMLNFMFSF